jgi:hypothetical protein
VYIVVQRESFRWPDGSSPRFVLSSAGVNPFVNLIVSRLLRSAARQIRRMNSLEEEEAMVYGCGCCSTRVSIIYGTFGCFLLFVMRVLLLLLRNSNNILYKNELTRPVTSLPAIPFSRNLGRHVLQRKDTVRMCVCITCVERIPSGYVINRYLLWLPDFQRKKEHWYRSKMRSNHSIILYQIDD